MIVIDTSAVLAILFEEPEAEAFMTRIVEAESPAMSAVSVLEAGLVMAGRGGGPAQWTLFDALLQDARVDVVAFDSAQATLARRAFLHYGRGRHPAGLNFVDCASYALAAAKGWPLLFKGEDFVRTDIPPALGLAC